MVLSKAARIIPIVAGAAAVLAMGQPFLGTLMSWAAMERGRTPLHDAAQRNDVEAIHQLVKSGANVNATLTSAGTGEESGFSGVTPLMLAALWGHYPATKALVDDGADIYLEASRDRYTQYEQVYTTFDAAVGSGNASVARLLWDRSDKQTFRKSERESITTAIGGICIRSELRDKANKTIRVRNEVTAKEMVEFLVDNVVDQPTWVAAAGKTLERPECAAQVALLTAHGFAPSPSAVAIVSAEGTPQLLAQLLAQGGDVNAKGKTPRYPGGVTPLFAAATALNSTAVRMLLDASADPNIINEWTQQTPLIAVVAGGGGCNGRFKICDQALEIVGSLLEHGARTDIRDKQGKTVFDYVDDRVWSPSTMPGIRGPRERLEAMLTSKSKGVPATSIDTLHGPRAISKPTGGSAPETH